MARTIPIIHSDLYEDLAKNLISEYDYIFYVSPEGVDIEDNGVRTTNSEYRDEVDWEIRNIIKTYRGSIKNFIELKGTTEERIEKVKHSFSPQYL